MPRAQLGALLLTACFGGAAATPGLQPVGEASILEFAERIQGFYGSIERRSLNALVTFQDAELHGYFGDPRQFADYYASLADQVKSAHFRYSRADAVRVREFRFPAHGRAEVDVVLVGRHQRALRFWDIEIERTDAWVLDDSGLWIIAPEKL